MGKLPAGKQIVSFLNIKKNYLFFAIVFRPSHKTETQIWEQAANPGSCFNLKSFTMIKNE